jgi:hypothetical protein
MSDNLEKKAEEVTVTRATKEKSLAKKSTDFVSSLTNTATLPTDPEQMVDELGRRMNSLIRQTQLSKRQKKEARETLSVMILKAQTLSIASDTRYIENLYAVHDDVRKRQLIKLWLDFIKKEGASIVSSLNEFVRNWADYSQAEIEKAEDSNLRPDRKGKVIDFISQNEQDMLDDITDILARCRQQNKEMKVKVEGQIK